MARSAKAVIAKTAAIIFGTFGSLAVFACGWIWFHSHDAPTAPENLPGFAPLPTVSAGTNAYRLLPKVQQAFSGLSEKLTGRPYDALEFSDVLDACHSQSGTRKLSPQSVDSAADTIEPLLKRFAAAKHIQTSADIKEELPNFAPLVHAAKVMSLRIANTRSPEQALADTRLVASVVTKLRRDSNPTLITYLIGTTIQNALSRAVYAAGQNHGENGSFATTAADLIHENSTFDDHWKNVFAAEYRYLQELFRSSFEMKQASPQLRDIPSIFHGYLVQPNRSLHWHADHLIQLSEQASTPCRDLDIPGSYQPKWTDYLLPNAIEKTRTDFSHFFHRRCHAIFTANAVAAWLRWEAGDDNPTVGLLDPFTGGTIQMNPDEGVISSIGLKPDGQEPADKTNVFKKHCRGLPATCVTMPTLRF